MTFYFPRHPEATFPSFRHPEDEVRRISSRNGILREYPQNDGERRERDSSAISLPLVILRTKSEGSPEILREYPQNDGGRRERDSSVA